MAVNPELNLGVTNDSVRFRKILDGSNNSLAKTLVGQLFFS